MLSIIPGKFLSVVLFLIFSIKSFSQPTLILTDSKETYPFGEFITVFEDRLGSLSIEDITLPDYADSFKVYPQTNHYVDKKGSVLWVKLTIQNKSKNQNKWLLELWDFRISSVQLFENKKSITQAAGYEHPFNQRKLKHKNLIVEITPAFEEISIYYWRINTGHPFYIDGAIKNNASLLEKTVTEYFHLTLFYGMIVALFLYNLILYSSTRNTPIIIYNLYLISIFFLATSKDGLGFQFLWHDYPQINQYIQPVSEWLMVCLAGWYACSFLQLKDTSMWLARLIIAVIILRSALFFIFLFYDEKLLYIQWYDIIPLAIYFYAGIISKIKGFVPARYYIVAFSFLFLGFLTNVLLFFNYLPLTEFTLYSLNIGVIGEVFFLSVGISDSIKNIMRLREKAQKELVIQIKEKEQLKDKVNRELEQKVQERTHQLDQKAKELHEANLKLADLSRQLQLSNVKLDKENWQLSKELIEKKKAIITDEELSFEEFSQVFPNELSCLRHLEEVKWINGFTCKRCSYSGFNEIKKFTRKCTKCDHIESATANTLFHSIKFPLTKAFYIVYISAISGKKITITELSDKLSLRYNTCSDFRKKVFMKKGSVLKKSGNNNLDKWEHLIMD